MRALATCVIALGLITSPAMAGAGRAGDKNTSAANTGNDSTANSVVSTAPAADSKTAAPAKAEASSVEIELDQLRDLVESQTKQLQEQQLALAALEAKLNAGSAATPADAAPAAAPVAAISTPAAPANAAAGKAQADTTGPASISYKGITLTPGGFMAAETVWRQKALGADINTPTFGGTVPFDGSSAAHVSEFNASGRQSRISMLVEGKLANVKIGGYYEMDFLSAGVTSNNNQSNSYTMRQRQFWGQAAFTNGFTLTGGQQWSLITETTHGMDNRTENLPMTIDAQYHVGFSWARQEGFRVTKNFNNKLWLGFAVEESQATLTAHGNPTVNVGGTTVCTNATCSTTALVLPTVDTNFLLGSFGTSGGLYNTLGNYAFNLAPDLVFKGVWEPGFGHYEVFGVLSSFHDRVFPCVPTTGTTQGAACPAGQPATSAAGAFNDNRLGGGGGANARWALMNKKVDVGVHFFGGSGIGRYGSSGLSDSTVRPDGTMALLRNYQALGTLQFHPTPKLDIYFNAGGEFTNRAGYSKTGGAPSTDNEGYGYPNLNNSGCWTETLPVTGPSSSSNTGVPTGVGGSTGFIPGPLGNCTGDIRRVIEGSVGFWYRFYNGPKGRIQAGMQYSNYIRDAFSGVGITTLPGGFGTSGEPHADENMIFTSVRYYLP
jgi:hypothetical protein